MSQVAACASPTRVRRNMRQGGFTKPVLLLELGERALRIAQIAPSNQRVPPIRYGGVERVVSYLTEELVRLGHEVTLFARGDSQTNGRLVPVNSWGAHESAIGDPAVEALVPVLISTMGEFDCIHFHTQSVLQCVQIWQQVPSIATVHWQVHLPGLIKILPLVRDLPLISVSNDQRQPVPSANWLATVPHGLPRDLYSFQASPGKYLVFLGRICEGKGIEQAIDIAVRSGVELKVAGTVYPEDAAYYREAVEPLVHRAGKLVELVGEVEDTQKNELLGNAAALLFPASWAEPFGLVMIEAMACGTPVIGWHKGSVPEIVQDGVSGFIVNDVEAAVRAVHNLHVLDRRVCRQAFEDRFTATHMARRYEGLYDRVLQQRVRPRVAGSFGGRW